MRQTVENWIESNLKFSSNGGAKFYKKPFKLLKWEKDIINALYVDKYKYKRDAYELLLLSAKKIGKTEFFSSLLLFESLKSPYRPHQTIIQSRTEAQANVSFGILCSMIENSPRIANRVKGLSKMHGFIKFDNKSEIHRLASGAGQSLSGLNPSIIFFDEITFFPDRLKDRVQYLKNGLAMREKPLIMYACNQPETHSQFFCEKLNYARELKKKGQTDKDLIAFLYESDISDAWDSEDTWRKVNPSYNITVSKEFYERKIKEIKGNPSLLVDFRKNFCSQNLGYQTNTWLRPDRLKVKPHPLGEDAVWQLGLDLSTSMDLTSVALISKHAGNYYIDHYSFIPDTAFDRRSLGAPKLYDRFLNSRYLKLFKGDSIEFDEVFDEIMKVAKTKEIQNVYFDPYRSTKIIEKLSAHFNAIQVRQGSLTMAPAISQFESDYYQGKVFTIKEDPVLSWAFSNARTGKNKSIVSKENSLDRIDPVMAVLTAYAGIMHNSPAEGFSDLSLIS